MKKITILFFGLLLILSSCSPSIGDDEDENEVLQEEKDNQKQETSLVPGNEISKTDYQTPVPYKTSAARGKITQQLGNRQDIDEMEEGLRRHSKSFFNPEEYLFEEGQYLDEDTVDEWLGRKLTEKQLNKKKEEYRDEHDMDEDEEVSDSDVEEDNKGLSPGIESVLSEDDADDLKEEDGETPKLLSHIQEQNFLERKDDDTTELAGVSIGLSLKSVYQKEDGSLHNISEKDIKKQGEKIAEKVVERIRDIEDLGDVPVMIAMYREESEDSPVSGNYIAKTEVDGGDMSIDDWEDIDEEYVLFPSDDAKDNHFEEHQVIEDLGEEIADYFPNYVGVIGEGFYKDDELEKLHLELPLDFYGKGEVIAFTQYVYDLIEDMFPSGYNLEVEITSSDELESMIYQEPDDEEPTVHIFD